MMIRILMETQENEKKTHLHFSSTELGDKSQSLLIVGQIPFNEANP